MILLAFLTKQCHLVVMTINSFKARAKINLFLHVTAKRPDDYHLIESMMVFAENIYDEISLSSKNQTNITGKFASKISSSNIIDKIINLLPELRAKPYYSIVKNIPVAAGMGGGSADAAAALKLLQQKFALNLSDENIQQICRQVGADVYPCYYNQACYASGIGDEIELIEDFPDLHVVVVNPLIEIETRSIFQEVSANDFSNNIIPRPKIFSFNQLVEFLYQQHNGLQQTAIRKVPEIATIIEVLKQQAGCMIARMSGSGASCFGIFNNKQDSLNAEKFIKKNYPNWWVAYSIFK